jgi:hypothetical protein
MRFIIEEKQVRIRSEFARTQWVRLGSEFADYQFRSNAAIAMPVAPDPLDPMLTVSWLNLGEENRNEDTQSERFQLSTALK